MPGCIQAGNNAITGVETPHRLLYSVSPIPEPVTEQPVRKPARAPVKKGNIALIAARIIPRQSMLIFIVVIG